MWIVWDQWEGGGFFSDGSYDGAPRYRAVNMQRYANGSIGPRPVWTECTQTAAAASSIPSTTTQAFLTQGLAWVASHKSIDFDPDTNGQLLLVARTTLARTISVNSSTAVVYGRLVSTAATVNGTGSADLTDNEQYGDNYVSVAYDSARSLLLFGQRIYDPVADAKTDTTQLSTGGVMYSKAAFYRNRVYYYGGSVSPNLVYHSDAADWRNATTGDGGNFQVGATNQGTTDLRVRGLYPLQSGLLIATIPNGSSFAAGGYPHPATFGAWYLLTGTTAKNGTLMPLFQDVVPNRHSLSIIRKNLVVFPLGRNNGYAVHDGSKVDRTLLSQLRPVNGQDQNLATPVGYVNLSYPIRYLNPVQTSIEDGVVLPLFISDTDPTAGSDGIGNNFIRGFQAFEFVNGAWTQASYWKSMLDIDALVGFAAGYETLYAAFSKTTDGTNYFPQIYQRPLTLNHPSLLSSGEPYTLNNNAKAASASGHPSCLLETWEYTSPQRRPIRPNQIVIDFDYWNGAVGNSSFFPGTGFTIEIVYRSPEAADTPVSVQIGPPIRPTGTTGVRGKRSRASVQVPVEHVPYVGTIQVRIKDNINVAIHSIAVDVDEDQNRVF